MLILALAVATMQQAPQTPLSQTYADEKNDLPAIRLTYKDAQELVRVVHKLVSQFNPPSTERDAPIERLNFKIGSSTFRFQDGQGNYDFSKLPENASEFSYSYSRKSSSPVSDVSINLFDYQRRVKVEGASQENINATIAAITQALAPMPLSEGAHAVTRRSE